MHYRFILSRILFCLLCLSFLGSPLVADSPDHQPPPEKEEDDPPCDDSTGDEEENKCKEEEEEEEEEDCEEGTAGDPFFLHNGEFFLAKNFLNQPESPLRLALRLHYRTFSHYNGVTGARWVPNYNMRVYETDEGALILRKDRGGRIKFTDTNDDGTFESQDILNETLTILGDGTYRLTTRRQLTFRFDTDGKLTAIADTMNNELRITYDGSW